MTPYRMPQMFELESAGIQFIRSWLKPPESPGLLAFWHAVEFRTSPLFGEQRPSAFFLGDHRSKPRSVVYFRPSQSGSPSHVFGAGESRVAVRWLATRPVLTFLLHAPPHWHEALEALVGNVQRVSVETWSTTRTPAGGVPGFVRPLSWTDSHAFHTAVPWWGLRGWGSFANLLEHGAAFGVIDRRSEKPGLMSIAWIFDQAGPYDAIAVSTDPRYQRLGLGKATASALIDHILNIRGKIPLWSTPASNEASIGLARALGLSPVARETLLSWPVASDRGTDPET